MKKIFKLFENFLAIVLILTILNVFLDVILRYFFQTGSIALQEFEWHLFSVMFLFGISYTLLDDEHVRVDFLYDSFKQKPKSSINKFGTILFLIPFSLLIIYGISSIRALYFIPSHAINIPSMYIFRFSTKLFSTTYTLLIS